MFSIAYTHSLASISSRLASCYLASTRLPLVFFSQTFANNIPRITSAVGPKREFMVLGFAAAQCVSMWWLGNTKQLK